MTFAQTFAPISTRGCILRAMGKPVAVASPKRTWNSMDNFNLLQWPAMVVTLLASWLVASASEKKRLWGFWIFLLSNILWSAWGFKTNAYALITLQAGLMVMNIRGAIKNHKKTKLENSQR
jgi:hypothetical protein